MRALELCGTALLTRAWREAPAGRPAAVSGRMTGWGLAPTSSASERESRAEEEGSWCCLKGSTPSNTGLSSSRLHKARSDQAKWRGLPGQTVGTSDAHAGVARGL